MQKLPAWNFHGVPPGGVLQAGSEERAAGLDNRGNELLPSGRAQAILAAGEIAPLREFRREMKHIAEPKLRESLNRLPRPQPGLPWFPHRLAAGQESGKIEFISIQFIVRRDKREHDFTPRFESSHKSEECLDGVTVEILQHSQDRAKARHFRLEAEFGQALAELMLLQVHWHEAQIFRH